MKTNLATAPPAPPDGTYVYALSRNGTEQGKTTVVVHHRDETGQLETDEAGAAGAAHASILGAFRYRDFGLDTYIGMYQAAFLRSSPLGAAAPGRPHPSPADVVTVRYHAGPSDLFAAIDGERGGTRSAQPRSYVFDAPFMTGVMLLPAFRHRTPGATLAPMSAAFDEGSSDAVAERYTSSAPHFPKTPKSAVALELSGLATIWFDRGNYIVYEAHFDRLNLDARLVSYARRSQPAQLEIAPSPAPKPQPSALDAEFASQDGTKLSGVLDLPANGKPHAPAVVFVPPGPSADRNFGGDGPDPMYPDLALAFARRGYAILRYDTRGVGKSGGSSDAQTWEQSLADAEAAIQYAGTQDAVDSARIYVLGYGNGADLALVASASPDTDVAGVVALAPTVLSYRACARRATPASASAFARSELGHDPRALAARSRAALFVLHPGAPLCGETHDETIAYDANLRAHDARATIVGANDLSARFGGLYDADSPVDTEEFFPYRFDASTADAIADWLDNPVTTAVPNVDPRSAGVAHPPVPPPPPPVANPSRTPGRDLAPGVIPPSAATPPNLPPASTAPAATPIPTPSPTP